MAGEKKIVIIARPNGAGKTTFALEFLLREAECPYFIDVDLIAAGLSSFDPEQPAIGLFKELGWETANCFYETFGPKGTLGRETPYDVVLEPKLRAAFRNPFGIHRHLCPLPEGEEDNSRSRK